VQQYGYPKGNSKGQFFGFVSQTTLGDDRPRPTTEQRSPVQCVFWNPSATNDRSAFINPVQYVCDDACDSYQRGVSRNNGQ